MTLKFCKICNKISATGSDHTDCMQQKRIELEYESHKIESSKKIDSTMMGEAGDQQLGVELKAILDHMVRERTGSEEKTS